MPSHGEAFLHRLAQQPQSVESVLEGCFRVWFLTGWAKLDVGF